MGGNVGIGDTTPGGKLDVTSAAVTDGYWLNGKAAITSADDWLRLNQSSAFTSGVYTPANFRSDGGYYGGGTVNLRQNTTVTGDLTGNGGDLERSETSTITGGGSQGTIGAITMKGDRGGYSGINFRN